MLDFCYDSRSMIENIITRSVEYLKLKAPDRETLILGVSGGADSALVAALARMVCDKTKLKLVGRSMPTGSTSKEELERSVLVGEAFCDNFAVSANLDELFYPTASFLEPQEEIENVNKAKVRYGNIKARLRMICLYNLAQANNGLVLGTDNLTEYLLGFWTLHGDVGDFGMIQNLWKTEVYHIMEYMVHRIYNGSSLKSKALALRACIDALPTDGLGVSKSDFDQLYPDHNTNASPKENYLAVDTILKKFLIEGLIENRSIVNRHLRSQFKRENPFNISREHVLHKVLYLEPEKKL